MQYMLLIHFEEPIWDEFSDEEHKQVLDEYMSIIGELESRGQFLGGGPLYPTSAATSVQVRGGRPVVMDGPFAETREQLGGYMLIDVGDLDEALRIAKRLPGARYGTVEVRPVMSIEEHFGVPDPRSQGSHSVQ
jgi:hypothetical protein